MGLMERPDSRGHHSDVTGALVIAQDDRFSLGRSPVLALVAVVDTLDFGQTALAVCLAGQDFEKDFLSLTSFTVYKPNRITPIDAVGVDVAELLRSHA